MKLVALEGGAAGRPSVRFQLPTKLTFGRLFLISEGDSEPKYEGNQIWVHLDIPDYTDITKSVINNKYPIKNYLI